MNNPPPRFLANEFVTIYNTTNVDLDGQRCRVLGRSYVAAGSDFYIIELQNAVPDIDGNTQLALSITEHCLRPV